MEALRRLGRLASLRPLAARAAASTTVASAAYLGYSQVSCESKIATLKMFEDKTMLLDLEIQQRFLGLDQGGKIQAEYVW